MLCPARCCLDNPRAPDVRLRHKRQRVAEVSKTENSDTVVTDRYGTPVPMGWNWGAFFLPMLWMNRNKVYLSEYRLFPIIPTAKGARHVFWMNRNKVYCLPFYLVPIIFSMSYLGANGSRLAWGKGGWDSAEHFIHIQRKWAWWGFGTYLAFFTIVLVILLIFYF